MSADNGIYIVPVTADNKTWFYVKYASAIENLFEGSNDDYCLPQLLYWLATAKRYSTEADALVAANKQAKKYNGHLEYGVKSLPPVTIGF